MADRSGAAAFGMAFDLLARVRKNALTAEQAARILWKESFGYDFSQEQMECDEALYELGLARYVPSEEGEEGDETIQYRAQDGRRWDR